MSESVNKFIARLSAQMAILLMPPILIWGRISEC